MPKLHSNLLWDLTSLFVVLTIFYFIIIFLFKDKLLARLNKTAERKKKLLGIIYDILLHEQQGGEERTSSLDSLKLELWKLIRVPGNKRTTCNILTELNKKFTGKPRQKIYELSKEFELQIDCLEKSQSSGTTSNKYNTLPKSIINPINQLKNLKKVIMGYTIIKTALGNRTQKVDKSSKLIVDDGLHIDFIPLITKNEGIADDKAKALQEDLLTNHDMDFLMEFLNIDDFEINPYEGVNEELKNQKRVLSKSKCATIEESFLNIDFLPLIYGIKEEKQEIAPCGALNALEVDCEVVIDPNIKKQISDILKFHVKEKIVEETLTIDEDSFVLDLGKIELPPAKFYSNRESKRVKLLHSIAELGDIREVPLLSEMLDVEKNESIAILTKEIIFKFLSESPVDFVNDTRDTMLVDFGQHYVLSHLFHSLGTESQLLLLEEILQIGDQTELSFLETLHKHSDKRIGDKAKSVSEHLKLKLQKSKDGTDSNRSNSLIELDLGKKINELSTGSQNTIKSIPFSYTNREYISAMNTKEALESDNIFRIEFDLSLSENAKEDNGSHTGKKQVELEELEEVHFLEQLKELTNRIFKK